MRILHAVLAVASAAILLQAPTPCRAGETSWPGRVLVTNDNGIDDGRLIELARALAKVAETHVVASTTDRSGASNMISAARTGRFEVERRDLGKGIDAYALDGYPADCVVFALSGPLRERPPDLVISGINGGANLGDDWFGSGTIGAARTAAYFGIPAIAVSGLDDDPGSVQAAVRWVVELVRSDLVRGLRPPQYLTVSLPRVPPEEIEGVVVTTRARGLVSGVASPVDGNASGARQTWQLRLAVDAEKAPAGSDVAAVMQNKIAIVPMRVNEFDPELSAVLRKHPDMLPDWSPPATTTRARPRRSDFGTPIDVAEVGRE